MKIQSAYFCHNYSFAFDFTTCSCDIDDDGVVFQGLNFNMRPLKLTADLRATRVNGIVVPACDDGEDDELLLCDAGSLTHELIFDLQL